MKSAIILTTCLLCSAGVSALRAETVYSGVQELSIPFTFEGISLNIYTGATAMGLPADWDTAPWINFDFGGLDISNGPLIRPVWTGTDTADGMLQVENLTVGTLVDNSLTFTPGENASSDIHTGPGTKQFQLGNSGYMAFVFNLVTGGPLYYGWAGITIDNTKSGGTIHDWAYENVAGTTLAVGAVPVPEPGTLALVVAGLGCWMRRRR